MPTIGRNHSLVAHTSMCGKCIRFTSDCPRWLFNTYKKVDRRKQITIQDPIHLTHLVPPLDPWRECTSRDAGKRWRSLQLNLVTFLVGGGVSFLEGQQASSNPTIEQPRLLCCPKGPQVKNTLLLLLNLHSYKQLVELMTRRRHSYSRLNLSQNPWATTPFPSLPFPSFPFPPFERPPTHGLS
jgi:hypothetical protein